MNDLKTCPKCGGTLPANAPSGICPKCLMLAGLASDDGELSGSGNVYAVTTPQPPGSGGFNPPPAASIAALFPQLEILEVLGHGGMGAVYKARQSKLDRIVALKIIRPESSDDPAFAERFNREARTLARLNHPHIVAVHDFGEVQLADPQQGGQARPLYYFVMEYVDGANLRQLMEARSVGADQALAIIRQICEALQFAHDEGIVHRDIKPENVLIDTRGRVKIADFGLAKLAARAPGDFTLTATHQVMGTPRYMAPEQMTGSHHVDHRADIYSLGVVFYELLTGEVPLGQFDPPSKRAPVDARLDGIVLRALAREPERRFQQASEMKSSVDIISSATVIQPAESQLPPHGASTIVEREIANAWRWMAGTSPATPEATPQFPTLLALLLAVAGSLMVLLPWMDVTIIDVSGSGGSSGVALVDITEPTRTGSAFVTHAVHSHPGHTHRVASPTESAQTILTQEGATSPSDSAARESRMDNVIELQPGESVTLYGSDVWPGLASSAVFACIALFVLMVPPRLLRNWLWNLQVVILSGVCLLMTVLFWMEVDGSFVTQTAPQPPTAPPAVQAPSAYEDVPREAKDILAQHSNAVLPEGSWVPLKEVAHRITYRPGFYGSAGLALCLLVVGATGVRRGISDRPDTAAAAPHAGSPVARIRFATAVRENIGQQVITHFESHGYRLHERGPDRWVFHRGSKMAGLFATDIRVYETQLSVRTSPAQPGQQWVTCLWEIRTLGAVITQKDVANLEDEGRELELMLNESAPAQMLPRSDVPAPTIPDASRIRDGGIVAAAPQLVGSPHSGKQFAAFDSKYSELIDLDEAYAEVDASSLALIVIGLLIAACHGYLFGFLLSTPTEDELAWIALPGCITGLGMVIGGLNLRWLWSRGWAQLGIIAGYIPASPGWLLGVFISYWAQGVLKRPNIAKAFVQRKRQRAQAGERIPPLTGSVDLDAVRAEVDGPSLAMIVIGLLIAVGHMIVLVFVSGVTALDGRMGVAGIGILGIVTGTGMLIGGLNLRTLRSRGWAQLGIISGFVPSGPGLVLSIPISAWSLAVFKRPHMARAFVQQRRERAQRRLQSELPRYSRKAIVGAIWAGLFIIFVLPAVMLNFVAMPATDNSPHVSLRLVVWLGLPFLFAPIGTTILGCMAIGDIRHSKGRIYGMGLAVTDALLFPLLLLNSALFAAFMYFNIEVLNMRELGLAVFISLGSTVAFGTGISAAIVQKVWKNEQRPAEPSQG